MMTQIRFMYSNEGINNFKSVDHLTTPSYWMQDTNVSSSLLYEVAPDGRQLTQSRLAKFDAIQPNEKNLFNITIIPKSIGGKKFRRLPLEIEALQIKDRRDINEFNKAFNFAGENVFFDVVLHVRTNNGSVPLNDNEWIVRGIKGEFYPCDAELFKELYEAIPEKAS